MEVRRHDSEEPMGRVEDVVVHPTEGRVVALLIAGNDGRRRVIDVDDFLVRDGVILARPYSAAGGKAVREVLLRGVRAARRLLGMSVVTDPRNALGYIRDRGKYLGSVRDVLFLPRRRAVVYYVGDAPVQHGRFYLAGSVPCAYSRSEERIEVPRRTEKRFAAASPLEAVELVEPRPGENLP